MKNLIKNLLLVLIFAGISLGVFEGFLLLKNFNYTPLKIEKQGAGDWRFYHAFETHHFIYDPNLIWKPKLNYGIFNLQGYRGKILTDTKAPNEYYIFAIGDSNTLGWDGVGGPHWPGYLEELLTKNNKSLYTVLNAGVWGYSSYQGLKRFKQLIPFKPDMVIISFGGNDAAEVVMTDEEYVTKRYHQRIYLDKFLMRLRTGQLIIKFLDKFLIKKGNQLVQRVPLEDYEKNLNLIIRLAKEHNIEVVLLSRSFRHEVPAFIYNEKTKEIAEKNNVLFIDMVTPFLGVEEYFTDPAHFTEKGHRLAAKIIHEKIKPLLP